MAQAEVDEVELGLKGSVRVLKFFVAAFAMVTLLGTAWLAWFDDRRLRMTDDFAAIAGTAILALLVTAFVEAHLYMKKAKEALTEYAEVAEEEAGDWPHRMMFKGRDVGEYVKGLAGVTRVWGLVTSVLTGDLVLITLWAGVDGHGPARWLAWFSFLSTGYGFVFVTVVALMKVTFDGEDNVQLFWQIHTTQRRIWQPARERREAELRQRMTVRRLHFLASQLRNGALPPMLARQRFQVVPPGRVEEFTRTLHARATRHQAG
jgi:hypothetical protein